MPHEEAWHAGDQSVTMDLEESGDGDDLLADNTMDGLEAPPELPAGAVPAALPQVAETPQQTIAAPALTPYSQPRSVFPGEHVCSKRPCLQVKHGQVVLLMYIRC